MDKQKKFVAKRLIAFVLATFMLVTQMDMSALTVQAATKVKAKSVALNYSNYTLKKGKKVTLKAKVAPANTKQKKVTWKSSKKSVATVNKKGVVKGIKNGKATITATVKGTKIKAKCKIIVGNPVTKVTVTSSSNLTMKIGETQAVKATVAPKNASNKNLVYSSNNKNVATVSAKGVITAKAVGQTVITVTAQDGSKKKASINVTVTAANGGATPGTVSVTGVKIKQEDKIIVSWDPNVPTKVEAEVTPANATNKTITWSSSKPEVATIDPVTGVITPVAPGSTVITATAEGGKTATITAYVQSVSLEKVSFEPQILKLEAGETVALSPIFTPAWATDKKLEYTSSNIRAATVDENGVVKATEGAAANAQATITATPINGGAAGTCTVIIVNPVTGITMEEEQTYEAGMKVRLTAEVTPKDASDKAIIWSSDNEEIATIDAQSGYLETKKPGTVNITATTVDGGFSATCKVNVVVPELTGIYLKESLKVLAPEETVALTLMANPAAAETGTVTWESSNPAVATVVNGVVTAVAKGDATITATAGDFTAECDVIVGNIKKVASFAELTATLAEETVYDGIQLDTTESGEFTIASGNYENTALLVNAPNATVTNEAVFREIEIIAISGDTWIEKATGNTIDVSAKNAHIIVNENAKAAIEIAGDAESVNIENNGRIDKISVKASADIAISGINGNVIPVEVKSADTRIETSIPVAVTAEQLLALKLLPGAESATSVTITNSSIMPSISGVGIVPVTDSSTGLTTDVVAEFMPGINAAPGGDGSSALASKGVITGIVKDALEKPIEGAVVYAIPYRLSFDGNQIQAAINAAERQEECYITNTDAQGKYETPELEYGNYVLIVKAEGKKNYFQTVTVTKAKINSESIVLVEDTDATSDIEGVLKDAATGLPVAAGITLYIRQGSNNVTGEILQTTTTDEDGAYRFSGLPSGSYCIQIEDKRDVEEPYVRNSYNVVVLANTTVQSNMTISQFVEGDQIRFVLSWGAKDEVNDTVPSDLDSHLVGPTLNDNEKFHVYFSEDSYYDNEIRYVDLDVDDTDYEGPETVTVYNRVDGLYHYYVYDYSNQDYEKNMMLATSQAVVNVYIGTRCVATYNVPYEMGTLWDVCTYDAATNVITPVNTVYYFVGDSKTVGLTNEDIANKKIKDYLERLEKVDFGEKVNAEVKNKIAVTKEAQKNAADAEELNTIYNELVTYVSALRASTQITEVTGDKICSAYVIRGGEEDLDSRSSINVQYAVKEWLDDSVKFVLPEGASYEVGDSDDEDGDYDKMVTVTSSVTGAVEKYYISETKYVPDWSIEEVTVNDADLSYYQVEKDGQKQLHIWGTEAQLGDLKVTFSDSKITYQCNPASEGGKAAVITATSYDTSVTIDVYYYQKEGTSTDYFGIDSVDDSANNNYIINSRWKVRNSSIKIMNISGIKDSLGSNLKVTFYDDDDEEVVANLQVTPEEAILYNYKATFTYNDVTYTVYIDYTKADSSQYLPYSAIYEHPEYGTSPFSSIQLQEIDGETYVLMMANMEEADFQGWESVKISNREPFSYKIEEQNGTAYLKMFYGEGEVASWKVKYAKYYSQYLSSNYFIDEGNYITGISYEDDKLVIYGENETLGQNLVYDTEEEGVSSVYEPVSDVPGVVGKFTISFGPYIKKIYDVSYKVKMRPLYLQGISSSENVISMAGNDSWIEEDDAEYSVHTVNGYMEELGNNLSLTLEDDDDEVVSPEMYTYEVKKVSDNQNYNYIIVVTFKGYIQNFYIRYVQDEENSILPSKATYTYNDYKNTATQVKFVEVDGVMSMRISGYVEEESFSACWDTVALERDVEDDEMSYKIGAGETEGSHTVSVYLGENLLKTYPIYYEKYANVSISSVKDGDNYISNIGFSYGSYNDNIRYQAIFGENDVFGEEPEFTFTDSLVSVTSYEKLETPVTYNDMEYTHKLVCGYKTQQQVFYIRYQKKLRTFGIQKVISDTNLITQCYSSGTVTNGENVYTGYRLAGYKEELGEVEFVFRNADNYNDSSVIDESLYTTSLEPLEDNENYEYKLTITFKGEQQVIYLHYEQATEVNILPARGTFTLDEQEFWLYSNGNSPVQLIDVNGEDTIRLLGGQEEEVFENCWDTLVLASNYYESLVYTITEPDATGRRILKIGVGTEVFKTYPVIYEKTADF